MPEPHFAVQTKQSRREAVWSRGYKIFFMLNSTEQEFNLRARYATVSLFSSNESMTTRIGT